MPQYGQESEYAMTEELRATIKRIRELSPKLNASTDEANRVIRQVESFLNEECSVGIRASACYRSESISEGGTEHTSLTYDRLDGKFRLLVRVEHEIDAATRGGWADTICKLIRETAWTQCPRYEKLESFNALPDLLKEIGDLAAKAVEQTTKSAEAVAQVFGAINEDQQSPERVFDINEGFFRSFVRDPGQDGEECTEYLDVETRDMVYVYEDDSVVGADNNRAARELVASDPSRFVEVPGIGGHEFGHQALRSFLDSDWTEDESLKTSTKESYDGSIRRWRERVGDDIYHIFQQYEIDYAIPMAREFWNEAMSKPRLTLQK